MKYVIQFLIIIAFCFVGEILHAVLPLPVPASIYGIVLLFLALETRLLKVEQIREVSRLLIALMPIMFLPAAAGLISAWANIKDRWILYLAITFISTFVVMGMAGWATQLILGRRKDTDSTSPEGIEENSGKVEA